MKRGTDVLWAATLCAAMLALGGCAGLQPGFSGAPGTTAARETPASSSAGESSGTAAAEQPETPGDAEAPGKVRPEISALLEKSGVDRSVFLSYREEGRRETRYAEYRDDEESLIAKLEMLAYINESRRTHGVQELELDILASRVANRMCIEAAKGDFSGHWNTRGEKPYHRYALAGGVDHVSENASALRRSGGSLPATYESAVSFMKDAHDRFMAEKADPMPDRAGSSMNRTGLRPVRPRASACQRSLMERPLTATSRRSSSWRS